MYMYVFNLTKLHSLAHFYTPQEYLQNVNVHKCNSGACKLKINMVKLTISDDLYDVNSQRNECFFLS